MKSKSRKIKNRRFYFLHTSLSNLASEFNRMYNREPSALVATMNGHCGTPYVIPSRSLQRHNKKSRVLTDQSLNTVGFVMLFTYDFQSVCWEVRPNTGLESDFLLALIFSMKISSSLSLAASGDSASNSSGDWRRARFVGWPAKSTFDWPWYLLLHFVFSTVSSYIKVALSTSCVPPFLAQLNVLTTKGVGRY